MTWKTTVACLPHTCEKRPTLCTQWRIRKNIQPAYLLWGEFSRLVGQKVFAILSTILENFKVFDDFWLKLRSPQIKFWALDKNLIFKNL